MKHTTSILILGALLLAGCAAEVSSPLKKGTHQIRYSVTVNNAGDDNTTRATIDADRNYVYSAGDVLFVRSTGADAGKVYGALDLDPQCDGKTTGVTFDGTLTVVDGFETQEGRDDTPLEAILVGSEARLYTFNALGDQITAGPTWPTDGVLSTSVAQAVERYSTLTAQSTYGQQSFHLSQGSCFVNFSVTLDDGTAAGTDIDAYVWTDNGEGEAPPTDSRSGTVTTVLDETDNKVKANFVAAFPAGTVLDGAVVGLSPRSAIGFGGSTSKTLEANKIYKVNKTFTRSAATISFNETSLKKSHPDARFQIGVNNTGDGTVTYTSDDVNVATVAYDEMDDRWKVTITGAGETDLKATVTDGANSVYSEHTVSCHLKVYDPVELASTTADHVGWVIGTSGKAYLTSSGVYADEADPVAIIGYVGDAGTADASSNTYRGLAIAMSDAATSVAWTDDVNLVCTEYPCDAVFSDVVASMRGIDNTARLATYACRNTTDIEDPDIHTHEAAVAAHNYSVDGFTPADHGCSPWFLPSTGQWFKVFQACGVATGQWTGLGNCPDSDGRMPTDADNHCADNYLAIQHLMDESGSLGERYWTSTERTNKRFAFLVSFGSDYGVNMHIYSKSATCNVLPFMAF